MSDINIGALSEAINDKMDRDGHNVQSPTAFIVETYSNGKNWYRVWSDGWCEQGGYSNTIPGSGGLQITFQVPMADTNYSVFGGVFVSSTSSAGDGRFRCSDLTTSGMNIDWTNENYQDRVFWEVKGYIS